jgi:putative protein kinase ArgK-like GTPase of G3E family
MRKIVDDIARLLWSQMGLKNNCGAILARREPKNKGDITGDKCKKMRAWRDSNPNVLIRSQKCSGHLGGVKASKKWPSKLFDEL